MNVKKSVPHPAGVCCGAMEGMVDRLIAAVARRYTRARIPSVTVSLLAEARMQAALAARRRHAPRALELAARMDAGEDGAAEEYGALATLALDEMREEVQERARALGPIEHLAAAAHHRFGDTDEEEYLDDPDLDRDMRVRLLSTLDSLNSTLGNYDAFVRAMEPLMHPDRPTRVLDLAAGHGGFAIAAARMARDRGAALEVTATDLKQEYLDIGREVAEREGLDVRFFVQDALDLSNLARGEYDVVMCTQSLHHFPAGMIARLFREAAGVAGRGVVLIDGCRSVMHGMLLPVLGAIRYRDRAFGHDAWVSFRRFFAPEELGLVVGLGPEGDAVEAKWMRPAHCLVRWRQAA